MGLVDMNQLLRYNKIRYRSKGFKIRLTLCLSPVLSFGMEHPLEPEGYAKERPIRNIDHQPEAVGGPGSRLWSNGILRPIPHRGHGALPQRFHGFRGAAAQRPHVDL